MSRRSAAVLGSIDTAMSVPSRDALTVTQRLPPRCIRDHGGPMGIPCSCATRAAAMLYAAAAIGAIGSSGGFRRSSASAAASVWLLNLQVGVEYHDGGPDWMQLPSWIDECAGDGRAQSGRHRAGERGEQAQFVRLERSAAVAPQVEHAPAAVPVGEYDDGGIADPQLALHVAPEQ